MLESSLCVLYIDAYLILCTFKSIRYTLLAGRPPFETNSLKETYERIKRCEYRLPSAMKPAASKLINSMLQPDPKKRPTVKEILHSEFFDGIQCFLIDFRFYIFLLFSSGVFFSFFSFRRLYSGQIAGLLFDSSAEI